MSVSIRRAAPADIGEISALYAMCFSHGQSESTFLTDIGSHDCYVAVKDGSIVGYACVWTFSPEAEINDICTHPAFRRQGIAELMMDAIISDGRKNGVDMISLEVRASNAPAKALYEKNGFVCEGIRKKYYDDREDALILRRRENTSEVR